MKRFLVTTSLALSLCCGAALAQQATDPQAAPQQSTTNPGEHHHHARNPQRQTAFLTQKLNLTPDQSAKVEPILAQRDQQMQALWQNGQLTPQDRHLQMRSINQSVEQQMAGVLSPEQMAQLKAMRHNGHHHGPRGEAGDNTQQPS